MIAEVIIGGVRVPNVESCRLTDSEIEIQYQLWDGASPLSPSPGATIDIVIHSDSIDQTYSGVIERMVSTYIEREPGLPRLSRATMILALSMRNAMLR